MPDQHAAGALTAAAVIATILIARAAVLRHSRRGAAGGDQPPRERGLSCPGTTPSPAGELPRDSALSAVREAEQHVHRCWQQLRTHSDPPE